MVNKSNKKRFEHFELKKIDIKPSFFLEMFIVFIHLFCLVVINYYPIKLSSIISCVILFHGTFCLYKSRNKIILIEPLNELVKLTDKNGHRSMARIANTSYHKFAFIVLHFEHMVNINYSKLIIPFDSIDKITYLNLKRYINYLNSQP